MSGTHVARCSNGLHGNGSRRPAARPQQRRDSPSPRLRPGRPVSDSTPAHLPEGISNSYHGARGLLGLPAPRQPHGARHQEPQVTREKHLHAARATSQAQLLGSLSLSRCSMARPPPTRKGVCVPPPGWKHCASKADGTSCPAGPHVLFKPTMTCMYLHS